MAKAKKTAPRARGGVSKEAKGKSLVPFVVNSERKFNLAIIQGIEPSVRKTEENGVVAVLSVHWSDPKNEREHYHTEWSITSDWENGSKVHDVAKQLSWQDDWLAHLFNTFMGDGAHAEVELGVYSDEEVESVEFPEGLDDETEQGWYLFFWKVAQQFKTARDGKPVYQDKNGKDIVHWLKLVYDKKGNLGVPKWGNFVDAYVKDKPTLLTMGTRDVFIKPVKQNAATADFTPPSSTDYVSDDLPAGF